MKEGKGWQMDIPLNRFSSLLLIGNGDGTEWVLFTESRFVRQVPLRPR